MKILIAKRKSPERNQKGHPFDEVVSHKGQGCFISFTRLPKIGLNPGSTYKTPIGVYTYQLDDLIEHYANEHNKTITPPFPRKPNRVYAWILKPRTKALTLNTLSEYELKHSSTIVENFGLRVFNKYGIDIEESDWKSQVADALEIAKDDVNGKDYGRYLWYFTNNVASLITKKLHVAKTKTPIIWNKVLRSLGYGVFIDLGDGIIHDHEMFQTVFLGSQDIKVVAKVQMQKEVDEDDYGNGVFFSTVRKSLEAGSPLTDEEKEYVIEDTEYLIHRLRLENVILDEKQIRKIAKLILYYPKDLVSVHSAVEFGQWAYPQVKNDTKLLLLSLIVSAGRSPFDLLDRFPDLKLDPPYLNIIHEAEKLRGKLRLGILCLPMPVYMLEKNVEAIKRELPDDVGVFIQKHYDQHKRTYISSVLSKKRKLIKSDIVLLKSLDPINIRDFLFDSYSIFESKISSDIIRILTSRPEDFSEDLFGLSIYRSFPDEVRMMLMGFYILTQKIDWPDVPTNTPPRWNHFAENGKLDCSRIRYRAGNISYLACALASDGLSDEDRVKTLADARRQTQSPKILKTLKIINQLGKDGVLSGLVCRKKQ